MRRRARLSKSQRGVAIVVALMAVLVLSILGTSLLFTTTTEDLVSRNYTAEVDALFAANTGLQMGIKHAMEDAIWGTKEQWADWALAVGGPTMTSPPTLNCPAICQDGNGSITGRVGAYYYDLRYFQNDPTWNFMGRGPCGGSATTRPALPSTPCTNAEWAMMATQPYSLPWTESWSSPPAGTGTTSDWLPNGGGYKIYYQGVPEGFTDPAGPCNAGNDAGCPVYRKDQIRILSIGTSGTAIQGKSGVYDNNTGTMMGAMERRSTRQVHSTYRVRDIGIWSNAFFAGATSGAELQGNALIRGSLHILNKGGNASSYAIQFNGNAGIRNNYSDMNSILANHLPPPPGNPMTLESEFRVRCGRIEIGSGAASVGTATNGSTLPYGTPGKGPLDAVYKGEPGCGSAWVGNNSTEHYEDKEEEYDASGFGLDFPDYHARYRDICNPQNTFAGGYDEFLRGLPGTQFGVHALDLTPFGTTPLGGLEFRAFDTPSDPTKCLVNKICPLAYYVADPTFRAALETTNLTHPTPRRNNTPPSDPDTSSPMDYFADPATNIVGIFKHLPGEAEMGAGNFYCAIGAAGTGHGFLFIPAGVSVPSGALAGQITDFIERNFIPYGNYTGIFDPNINWFLGRASGNNSRTAAIGNYVDYDKNNASNTVNATCGGSGGCPSVVESNMGRLLVQGVTYIHDFDVIIGSSDNSSRRNFVYMGRGTFAVGATNTSGPTLKDLGVESESYVIPLRPFPCVDALGFMSPNITYIGNPGRPADQRVSAAVYGRNQVTILQNSEVSGALVSLVIDLNGATGSNHTINQVPDLAGCLPPNMIGDWSYYVTRSMNWSEH